MATLTRFERICIEQIAGGIAEAFDERYETREETIERFREINDGEGFAIEISAEQSGWFIRHENVSLSDEHFDLAARYAAALADASVEFWRACRERDEAGGPYRIITGREVRLADVMAQA